MACSDCLHYFKWLRYVPRYVMCMYTLNIHIVTHTDIEMNHRISSHEYMPMSSVTWLIRIQLWVNFMRNMQHAWIACQIVFSAQNCYENKDKYTYNNYVTLLLHYLKNRNLESWFDAYVYMLTKFGDCVSHHFRWYHVQQWLHEINGSGIKWRWRGWPIRQYVHGGNITMTS